MKINHFNSTDTYGGAAKMALSLVGALSSLGVDANLYVQTKTSNSELVKVSTNVIKNAYSKVSMYLDLAPLIFYPHWSFEPFYSNKIIDCNPNVQAGSVDIINLHNVTRGFIRLENLLKVKKPIVWTLHDSWAFTGGCTTLFSDCQRYKTLCEQCPVLGSARHNDLAYRNWVRKSNIYPGCELTLVCPSKSMANNARSSSLFKNANLEIIPNGIDLELFHPTGKIEARSLLNLDLGAKYLLFGANFFYRDKNKGFQHFVEAIRILSSDAKKGISILTFGSEKTVSSKFFDLPVLDFGYVDNDRKMALLYSASDITVVPSEKESFGLIPIESMACGTPVVAFNVPAINDNIFHKWSGYLAKPFDPQDMANGIRWLLEEKNLYNEIVQHGLETVKNNYSLTHMANQYLALYRRLLKR